MTGPALTSRTAVRNAGVLVAATVVVLVPALLWSGAVAAPRLGDPGALVRWALPLTATIGELAGAITLGALTLAACVLPRRDPAGAPGAVDGRAWPRATQLAGVAAAVWTLVGVAHLVLTYASVAGQALSQTVGQQGLMVFVLQVDLGRTLASVVLVAAAVTALSFLVATPTGVGWTVLLVVVALWQQAQTGHAAGTTSHHLATSAMVVHLVSAAVWVGGLAALALLVGRFGSDLTASVARYSVLAGWCTAGVVVSGVVNAWIRLDGPAGLGTRWGVLLMVKTGLVVVLGLLGLLHRRRTLPLLADRPSLFWRVLVVELAVMGAVSAVAVALGSTAPPDPGRVPTVPSPAFLLTGEPLPPQPTLWHWLTLTSPDLVTACAAVSGVVVYLRWVHRLHRRGDAWPWLRTASWLVGMVGFAWTTNGGAAVYGHVLFSAHMVQHMVLATVIPIFLALSGPVTLALRALPVRAAGLRGDTSRGPREWLLVLVQSHWGRFLANPLVAAANFAGSMVVFYYTDVFGWALADPVGHLFMVVHFSLAGYLFANALVGIDPGPARPSYPLRLLLLFATMGFHAFFGVTLQSGKALLVADWFGLMGRPWGPSALVDQQLGGSVAWGIGELPTLALAVAVAVAWSRDDERAARRRDRRVDRSGDTELDEYNEMLGRLASRDEPR